VIFRAASTFEEGIMIYTHEPENSYNTIIRHKIKTTPVQF